MELKRAVLVLVDISGYTQFLKYHSMSVLHAEDVILRLMEAVIDKAKYPIVLNKLEGDAALLYALLEGDESAIARDVVKQLQSFFAAFNAKANELACSTTHCVCEACRNVVNLKLKAVMHSGDVAFKQLRQFKELGGENAIIPHRMLKNNIPSPEYIAMTEPVHRLTGDVEGLRNEWRTESYADIGQIKIKVFYLPGQSLPVRESSFWQQQKMTIGWLNRALLNTLGQGTKRKFSHISNEKTGLSGYFFDSVKGLFDVSRYKK